MGVYHFVIDRLMQHMEWLMNVRDLAGLAVPC